MPDKPKTVTSSPAVPPLVDSPQFQDRTSAALGGKPTNPASFQPITAGGATANVIGAAQVPQRRSNSTFDVDPTAEAMRSKINNARTLLSNLIDTIDNSEEQIKAVVDELKASKEGKDEAARQGFDLDVASSFLDGLTKSVDQVKPKTK